MPRERLPMRKIRDVLRLHAVGHSKRAYTASKTETVKSQAPSLRQLSFSNIL